MKNLPVGDVHVVEELDGNANIFHDFCSLWKERFKIKK